MTGDWPQWIAWWTGIYAVFSWTQSLKRRDPATHKLIWGTPIAIDARHRLRQHQLRDLCGRILDPALRAPDVLHRAYRRCDDPDGGTAAEEVSTIFGWSAAAASAIGVILGGIVSDILRQRHAAGRLYVNMAAIVLPIPAVIFLFTTDSLASFYIVAPYVSMCSALWVGAAVATLQDLVLPRMRGTAGATYVLGTSLVGLALGPYFAGKVAALTGDLATGMFSLYIVPPFTLAPLDRVAPDRRNRSHSRRARCGSSGLGGRSGRAPAAHSGWRRSPRAIPISTVVPPATSGMAG